MGSVTSLLNPRLPYTEAFKTDQTFLRWANQVTNAVNVQTPSASYFSLTTPNSIVTATRGTLGINLNSTVSVLWAKQVGSGNTGWVAIA
jgi:hypothetical protein